jgi:hypothetical protein
MKITARLARPAAVAALAAAALAIPAASAGAEQHDPCATARAVFRAQMNEARFWIGAADRLAGAGLESSAQQATDIANQHLGQAEAALNDMSAAC